METRVASANNQRVPDGLELESKPKPTAEVPAEPAKIKDPAIETEDKYARYMGTISTVNPDWRFCILKLRTTKELRIGDTLSVKTATIVPSEATLEITKIEGNQAVADLVDGADLESIRVGQAFYQWTEK